MAPEVRYDPATGRTAIKTSAPVALPWFIFSPTGGGHYATGDRGADDVTMWQTYTPPVVGG